MRQAHPKRQDALTVLGLAAFLLVLLAAVIVVPLFLAASMDVPLR